MPEPASPRILPSQEPLRLLPGTPELRARWEDFARNTPGGTCFHRLDFLDYHGERFTPHAHPVTWWKGGALMGLMPMAILQEGGQRVARAPYGASFGGPLLASSRAKYVMSAVATLGQHLEELEVDRCRITLPPPCYGAPAGEALAFALHAHGYRLVNRELTHVVDLRGVTDPFQPLDSSTRTQARKARKLGVTVQRDAPVSLAYPLVVDTRLRLGNPDITHSLADLERIQALDPSFLKVDLAWFEGEAIAANVFLRCPRALISFYPSHLKAYAHTSALSLLTLDALAWCLETGQEALDFGCSSVGGRLNNALAEFKESFGARGQARDTWEWSR